MIDPAELIQALKNPAVQDAIRAALAAVDDETGIAAERARSQVDHGVGNSPCRVYGPYRHRSIGGNEFKIMVLDVETKRKKYLTFDTIAEAARAIPQIKRDYQQRQEITIAKAIKRYAIYLDAKSRTTPNYVEMVVRRLKEVFGEPKVTTHTLDSFARWNEYVKTTRRGIETKKSTLAQCKAFLKWLVRNHHASCDTLDGIQIQAEAHEISAVEHTSTQTN